MRFGHTTPCRSRRPPFRCLLTQTTRDSIIAKQIREEIPIWAKVVKAAGMTAD